jgi:dihydroorotate dehydrogenase (fumarate)
MDLTTRYLGLDLAHPFIPGASPLADDLTIVQRLAEAGAPAITMRSLFEEQIVSERERTIADIESYFDSFAEARSFFPQSHPYTVRPDAYLANISRIKQATGLPVIGSLNGTTPSGWLEYAKLIQEAGAAALELNVYHLATDFGESGASVEERILATASAVKAAVSIPVAVKLSPFFSSLPHLARSLEERGIEALVLFNRFYQPDIDAEALEVVPRLELSSSSEVRMRLRWTALLAGRIRSDIAISGGIHTVEDAVKGLMCGATVLQLVSVILRGGPAKLRDLASGLGRWLEDHEYESLAQLRGSMSLSRCPDPAAFERANYMRVLHDWRPPKDF